MSTGDIKGARRRLKARQQRGEAPTPKGGNVHQSIERERAKALRMAKAAKKKV